MKKILTIFGIMASAICLFYACKKNSNETTVQSTPAQLVGAPVTPGNISGTIKGTMTTGNTYVAVADISIAIGDTLYLQPGVTVKFAKGVNLAVYGVLISLGTQSNPNYFTSNDPTAIKINSITVPAADPAFTGYWTGINCDTSCTLLCLKWTHVDFAGANFTTTYPFVYGTQGKTSYAVLFQNSNGDIVVEDSWFYGCVDDCIRIQYGRISIMRNTFEKSSFISGDVLNAKHGAIGDMAYNLFVGTCTNGTKAADKGTNAGVECNINMYNNTYINGGYRQGGQAGRSGAIDYEQGAEGKCYNNLLVNCRVGPRINNAPIADTVNCFMGNNYCYGDSASVVDQDFPVGYVTQANALYFPTAAQCGYVYNPNGAGAYDASALVSQGNPLFVNFPLPEPGIMHLSDIDYVGSFDFHLASNSPCNTHGNTSFSPLNATKVPSNSLFSVNITPPGADIGCYQSDLSGNQH